MFAFRFQRPRLAQWRDCLPPIALFLAMFAALLALGGDRGYFYRPDANHDHNSAQALLIAENLSPRHNFRQARRVWLNEDGGYEYDTYARFPIGGFALIKAAIAPFGDAAAKLLAARIFMLLMFCGAAVFAYLAIARIAGNRSVALAAVLLAFSGFYALYYADGVFNEGVMELFGAALAFHGMTVFVQEGRFRQLLVKTCAALLVGWHVYALLLPFIAIGFGGEAVALIRSALSSGERAKAMRSTASALLRSRYVALAAAAVLFGAALLAFNFANEYLDYGRDGALSDMPMFQSVARRFGQTEEYDAKAGTAWGDFFRRQFYRVGAAAAPNALASAAGYDFPALEPAEPPLAPTLYGLAAACAALGALALSRRCRILTATAVLFGFCWAIPLRYNTFDYEHAFEGLPYMGLALALFAFVLAGARRLLGERVGGGLALAAAALAAPVFALSVFQVGQTDRNPGEAEREKAAIAEFSAMRPTVNGKRLALSPDIARFFRGEGYETVFFLADSFIGDADAPADYAISRYRDERFDLLTPDNRFAFLYGPTDMEELYRAERRWLESLQPAARSVFDVYLEGDTLRYLKSPCAADDALMRHDSFFLHVYPAAGAGEFHGENFYFEQGGNAFDDVCVMIADLPPYPIAAIRTGQYIPAGGARLWEVFITPPLDGEALEVYEDAYREIIESGEPAARSDFDVYLTGGALRYLKEPCDADDTRGRFFLSVHPADERDLPADMRERGHESLNFTFAPPLGAVFNGKCMASRRLPDYEIAQIETGQWIPGGERLWSAEIVVGD